LTNATFNFARLLANKGWVQAAKESKEILTGINIVKGAVTCKAVAEAFDLEYMPVEKFLN
jgi:alanine dehydrogenase